MSTYLQTYSIDNTCRTFVKYRLGIDLSIIKIFDINAVRKYEKRNNFILVGPKYVFGNYAEYRVCFLYPRARPPEHEPEISFLCPHIVFEKCDTWNCFTMRGVLLYVVRYRMVLYGYIKSNVITFCSK